MTKSDCELVLASASPYRKQQLDQLGLCFQSRASKIDETALPAESAKSLSQRLSIAKAQALRELFPDALIIGSDQTAALKDQILGKPLSEDKAITQLLACSGQTVTFYSGLCLYDAKNDEHQETVVETRVKFRSLTHQQIEAYVRREQPLDCAGSFKCEGLGISLFESIISDDPSALIGLPLIQVTKMLSDKGVDVLTHK